MYVYMHGRWVVLPAGLIVNESCPLWNLLWVCAQQLLGVGVCVRLSHGELGGASCL